MMNKLPVSQKTLGVYLINLDRATVRLANMDARLSKLGLAYHRVTAVDGNLIHPTAKEFSRISYMLLHGRRPIPPEIGCYLSHVQCVREFLDSKNDFALILEDDVEFKDDFISVVDAAIENSKDWDILRLTTVSTGKKFSYMKLLSDYNLSITLTRNKGAGAYIINKRAGKWIESSLMPMRLSYDIAFDLEFLSGLRAAFVDPMPANQITGYETQIQININNYKLPLYRYLTVLPYRTYLEILRVSIRGFRLVKNIITN